MTADDEMREVMRVVLDTRRGGRKQLARLLSISATQVTSLLKPGGRRLQASEVPVVERFLGVSLPLREGRRRIAVNDLHRAADVADAIQTLTRVRKRLTAKPKNDSYTMALELSAAEMQDGEGQGSEAYLYVPADLAPAILDVAEKTLRDELNRLGVQP